MNLDLHYSVSGSGVPFVFQHGLGASLEQPLQLMSELTGLQLISADMPGHGKSFLAPGYIPSFNQYADAVIHLLDKLQIKQALFGGISMGSGIAVNIATRFPERVLGLLLVRPAWLDYPGPANLRILLEVANYLDAGKSASIFSQASAFTAFRQLSEGASQSVLRMFTRVQGEDTATVLSAMVNDQPFEQIAQLQSIQQPALIFGSDNDPLHPFDMADKLHQHLPFSRLEKVIARYLDNDAHRAIIRKETLSFVKQIVLQ